MKKIIYFFCLTISVATTTKANDFCEVNAMFAEKAMKYRQSGLTLEEATKKIDATLDVIKPHLSDFQYGMFYKALPSLILEAYQHDIYKTKQKASQELNHFKAEMRKQCVAAWDDIEQMIK